MFSPELAPVHRRIGVARAIRDTRLLVVDRALLANPLGMLWPEMDVTFVS